MNPLAPTILVIDDSDASRYASVHALTAAGFAVVEAGTGGEGLELANDLPAVILLDVRLPDIFGYEVCRRIKANPHTSHIPVLQLSAVFLNDESKIYALESGADAYLTLPAEPAVLIATVRSLVRVHDAEAHVRLSVKQWQATFDALSEGVAVIDSAGVIERCNRAMTTLLGRPYREIERTSLATLVQQCFGLQMNSDARVSDRQVQTGTRHFRFDLSPIVGDGGKDAVRSGSIFVLSETTHQKRAEAALVINERLAATGRMANTIAHEINNPLEAITNLVYLLNREVEDHALGSKAFDTTAAMEYLAFAKEEISRVCRITRQILSFHRESDTRIPIAMAELFNDVLALSNRGIVEKNLRIQKQFDSLSMVVGFPGQLRQVLSNLLRNAIEASAPESIIHLRISGGAPRRTGREPEVRITVCDHGAGITVENMKRIFDAFFTTKQLKGSGVGLWLSATIVEEHGGRIRVRSSTQAAAHGTCFSVVLPSIPGETAVAGPAALVIAAARDAEVVRFPSMTKLKPR